MKLSSIANAYNNSSIWCKLLLLISFVLLLMLTFKDERHIGKEAFSQDDKFLLKNGEQVYDDFYASVYDYLVFNTLKDEYEVGWVLNNASPSSKSVILDIGCGTGHHVGALGAKGMDILGIDVSPSMIAKAKENYPDYKFEVGNALNNSLFEPNRFTHILCLYFTIYYFENKEQFFRNCFDWLMPGGYLIVHLVDRKQFDPILPPGNPLMYVSPQRYAKQRITSTKVQFTDFSYKADFKLDESKDRAIFEEKFQNKSDGKVRKNEHVLYMPEIQEIVDTAMSIGFISESQADLLHCQYEYQYLYMFIKPM